MGFVGATAMIKLESMETFAELAAVTFESTVDL